MVEITKVMQHKSQQEYCDIRLDSLISWYNNLNQNLCADYVSGYTDAEGCFCVTLSYQNDRWPLVNCQLVFKIGCHPESVETLYKIQNFLGFKASVRHNKKRDYVELLYTEFKTISEGIVPFFQKNPLLSSKQYDFLKFVEVAELMKKFEHRTIGGMEKIIRLAYTMNSNKDKKSNLRRYTIEQSLEYLKVAKNREQYRKLKDKLPQMKKHILENITSSSV